MIHSTADFLRVWPENGSHFGSFYIFILPTQSIYTYRSGNSSPRSDYYEGFKIVLYFFQAVDAEAVRAVLFKYVYDRCPVVAAVGPVEQVPDYNVIRNGMYYKKERNKVSEKIEHLKAILTQAELPKVANKFDIWYLHSLSLLIYFSLN